MVVSDHRLVSSLVLTRAAMIRLAAQRPSISAECSIALVVPFLLVGFPVDSLDDGCRWRCAREGAYMSELRIAGEAATSDFILGMPAGRGVVFWSKAGRALIMMRCSNTLPCDPLLTLGGAGSGH